MVLARTEYISYSMGETCSVSNLSQIWWKGANYHSRGMDLAMKTLQNAQERDQDDWVGLFKRASPRFKFISTQTPRGSQLSIIEFEWV